ncbi:EpsG family protein [Frigidibacter sp.]|uniref:EpsG family protein n=1 Tax=Frigidibacter sp. TaxID=2586418 RepID=UPI0027331CDF|nr:EpsG family protein [Frigidibacter sp.]MDP3342380.1 EpsG family protein [Frigidibacter sp.]
MVDQNNDAGGFHPIIHQGAGKRNSVGSILQIYRYIAVTLFAIICSVVVYQQAFGINKDWSVYTRYYMSYFGGKSTVFTQVEPAFRLIFSTFARYDVSLSGLLASIAIFSLLIKFYVLTAISRSLIPSVCYLAAFFPLHEYTQIRVAFAIALAFWIIRGMDVSTRSIRFAPYFLPLFHMSSSIVAMVYFATRFMTKASFLINFAIASACVLALSLSLTLITSVFPASNLINYLAGEGLDREVKVLSITNMIYTSYIFCFLVTGLQNKSDGVFLATLLSALAIPVVIFFVNQPVLSDRFKEFLFAFSIITFASLIRNFRFTIFNTLSVLLYALFSASSLFVYINNGVLPILAK